MRKVTIFLSLLAKRQCVVTCGPGNHPLVMPKRETTPLPNHAYSTAQHDILILLKASIIFRSSKHIEGPAKQQVSRKLETTTTTTTGNMLQYTIFWKFILHQKLNLQNVPLKTCRKFTEASVQAGTRNYFPLWAVRAVNRLLSILASLYLSFWIPTHAWPREPRLAEI